VAADGGKGDWVDTEYSADFQGNLEPGDYIITASVGYASVSQPVTIEADKVAEPHFVLNGAILKLRPRPSEGAEVDENATVEIRNAGKYVTTSYGEVDLVVPAGALEVDVSIGEATVTRSYEAKAGETIDEDVVLGVGLVRFATEYVEGMPVEADIFLEIYEAKKALDGTRKSVTYGYGGEQDFELPAGDYVVTYKLKGAKGEIAFSVTTAELTEVPIILNAGILAVATPSDEYVEVFGAAKTIEGNRQSFDYGYGPDFQTTLPAGDYVVFTRKGDTESETPVTVTAGERFELTVQSAPAGGKTK
jgi:Ca-activated chloride channel family protein